MGTISKVDLDKFTLACESYPKYQALAWVIEQAIHEGELVDRQKLPPQRQLADALNITHGTVTRAYALLEKKGIVTAKLGAGTYVTLSLDSHSFNSENSVSNEYDFASSMQPMLGQQLLVKKALSALANDIGAIESVMNYSYQGIDRHKTTFLSWLATRDIQANKSDICFTYGAQQGIYTCLQLLTRPEDFILHEDLSYPGFFRAVGASHVTPLGVPITDEGLDLEVLEQYCQQFKPKLLYITPNMQNPTNTRYTTEQLDRIVELSIKYQFYIIEDDVNYCLPEDWHLPLQQRAKDRVFYVSSLSKYVAGGLRIAYTLVPEKWQQAFNDHIHSQSWMVPTISFELGSRFILSDEFKQNQAYLADEIRYRRAKFSEMVARYGFTTRQGGLNIWLTLPDSINVDHFNRVLISNRIKVRPADLFCSFNPQRPNQQGFRISLGGFTTRNQFEHGVDIFEEALQQLNDRQDVII
ncbi:aminotransferase-like domain-containing protein [Vibrio sp. WJH972]